MIKKIILIYFANYLLAVGLGGAALEVNAISLANYGTGIAGDIDASINPASIVSDSTNKLTFSYNKWFNEVAGSTINNEWANHYLSLSSYELNNIDLWGEAPDSHPLGTFGSHYVSLTYGKGMSLFKNLHLGINSKIIHARLYTESTSALLFDVGTQYNINSILNIGFVIRNSGIANSNLSKNKIPTSYGIGTSLLISKIKTQLLFDFNSSELAGTSNKLAMNTKFGFMKFFATICVAQHENLSIDENIFFSSGFEFKYRRWSFIYGIVYQKNESLGMPQSFQVVWHY